MRLWLIAMALALGGCRLARYTLEEPLDNRVVEVKSGDRINVVLDEDPTTGFVWEAECTDGDISFARETIEPDRDSAPVCGAGRKVKIIIRVHRGFDGPSHVRLFYRRPWKGGETARTIDLLLYHTAEDNAPWK